MSVDHWAKSTDVLLPAVLPGLPGKRPGVPGRYLASRSLLEGLAWPATFLVEGRESAKCEKHLFLSFHPQKMESCLPRLTREWRFLLLALSLNRNFFLLPGAVWVLELCMWNEGWTPRQPITFCFVH